MASPKVTGGGFAKGALGYDFDGSPGKQRDPPGEWVAGSCVGSSAAELLAQFKPILTLRPEAKNPVWRCSINLHPSDGRLTPAEWDKVSRRFLELMGVNPERAVWCSVNHKDRPHDHAHLTLSRVLPDGSLWDRANDVKRAIKACAQIERESIQLLGRQLHVHDRSPKEKRGLTRGEKEIMNREGRIMSREFIQLQVDTVLKAHPQGIGLTNFVRVLKDLGINALPYLPKGKFKGMSYRAQGISWPGSKLGTAYTNIGLIHRGVRFEVNFETSSPSDVNPFTNVCLDQPRDKWWYRHRVDVVCSKYGQYSKELEVAVAALADVGFEPHDEMVYQLWLDNSSEAKQSSEQPPGSFMQELDDEFGLPRDPDIYS